MTDFIRIGEDKTYHYYACKNAFEEGYGKKFFKQLVEKYVEKYDPAMPFHNFKIIQLPNTLLGPSYQLQLQIHSPYIVHVQCYRDGWHIGLTTSAGSYISVSERKIIFNDPNKDKLFTTETELVLPMLGELRKHLIDLFH